MCVCVCFVYLHIIQYNKGSYREHITGDLNINLYGCVGLLATECAVYVLCVISNPSTIKKQHYVRINSKIKLQNQFPQVLAPPTPLLVKLQTM